jgi:hypothetical protein
MSDLVRVSAPSPFETFAPRSVLASLLAREIYRALGDADSNRIWGLITGSYHGIILQSILK